MAGMNTRTGQRNVNYVPAVKTPTVSAKEKNLEASVKQMQNNYGSGTSNAPKAAPVEAPVATDFRVAFAQGQAPAAQPQQNRGGQAIVQPRQTVATPAPVAAPAPSTATGARNQPTTSQTQQNLFQNMFNQTGQVQQQQLGFTDQALGVAFKYDDAAKNNQHVRTMQQNKQAEQAQTERQKIQTQGTINVAKENNAGNANTAAINAKSAEKIAAENNYTQRAMNNENNRIKEFDVKTRKEETAINARSAKEQARIAANAQMYTASSAAYGQVASNLASASGNAAAAGFGALGQSMAASFAAAGNTKTAALQASAAINQSSLANNSEKFAAREQAAAQRFAAQMGAIGSLWANQGQTVKYW